MIDLNQKHHISNHNDDLPIGAVILIFLPLAFAFWTLVELGL